MVIVVRMYDIIEKKKRGLALDRQEIRYVIEGFTGGVIPDYQMSALLMAIWFNGMDKTETYELTMAMMESGERLDLSAIRGVKVDKHSTGGVGDKTTLILGPIVAACGVPVAKMSGRGLGHTGGTIDKLESIEGFNTAISTEQFINQVNTINIAVAGQTTNLAPADKKIYALRDVTATVDNRSLIASSIMSKKLASGADAIVLDVKYGNGAFMKDFASAKELADEMIEIGQRAGKEVCAVISDMNQPLGRYVGNSLEVYEAVMCLRGEGDETLMSLCKELASHMLLCAGTAKDSIQAMKMIDEVVKDGRALDKLAELVKAQEGNEDVIRRPELLPKATIELQLTADNAAYVESMDTEKIGKACLALGGGRETKDSVIDLSVGIYLNKKTGEYAKTGETLAIVYASDMEKGQRALELLKEAYKMQNSLS